MHRVMQTHKHLACTRVHPPTSRRKTLWLDDVLLASAERPPGTRHKELVLVLVHSLNGEEPGARLFVWM